MDAIGTIRTPYKTKQDCPIQPLSTSGSSGRVEVLEQYADGLKVAEEIPQEEMRLCFKTRLN